MPSTTLTMTQPPANGSKVIAKLTNNVDFEEDTAIEGVHLQVHI